METKSFRDAPPLRPSLLRVALRGGLLALTAVLAVGTSKTLHGKKLVAPHPEAPAPLKLEGPPEAWLAEDVDNQGCFSDQVLNLSVRIPVRNVGSAPLEITPKAVTLTIDGRTVPVQRAQFAHPRKPSKDSPQSRRYGPTLPPNTRGELFIAAHSVLSKEKLKSVERAQLRATLGKGSGELRLDFPDIKNRPVQAHR
jgi:hypothetical protein